MKKILTAVILFSLLLSTGSEALWFQQSSPSSANFYSVVFNHGNENQVWICGSSGTILYSSNGGSNWTIQNSGTTNDLYSIVFMEIQGAPVYACGEGGIILRTSNNGAEWTSISSPVSQTLRDISDFNFVAVGDSGVIIKSINSGLNWFSVSSPVTKNLYAVALTFSGYAVGQDGTILAGISAGTSWSVLQSGVTNDLRGVPLFGSRDITVGDSGMILRSSNFGSSWFTQNSLTKKNINSTEYSVNNTSKIYCAGDSGVILKTTDSGVNWGFQNSGTFENLNSVFFYLDDNTGYAVGNNGTILKTTNGGGLISSVNKETETGNFGFYLNQNFPNPFNPQTKINYSLTKKYFVEIKIYDVLGNEMSTPVSEKQNPGSHSVSISTDDFSKNISSGIYFYSLVLDGNIAETKKMILLK